jgi:hypothetical protein
MKHLNKILIAVMMVMGLPHAQDSNNPALFGVNAIDTRTSAGGGNGWFDQLFQPSLLKTMECSSICILHQCIKI